ncbi:ceramidase domain-containing protein [Pelagibius marinus]|uniref:ceramidase domain-containing protein n=1 Tax=Pelagibius marinus TaxID=2762760 RepID=UPI0018726F41|nr:ceramidase domain-containing protein [Pelagibius marinus]
MDRAIDLYCERVGPGLWGEPLNAVTNLAFILAGVLLVAALRRDDAARRDPAILALVALILLVGIGSGLFHTFATAWAVMADVIPVALFILLYMYLALYRLVALPLWGVLAGVAIVLVLVAVMPLVFGFSASTYGVALVTMLGVGGFLHFGRRHPAGRPILAAAGVFALSLAFRTADLRLCAALPVGTHFLWHMMNAVVLYNLTRTMMAEGVRGAARA